jgi:hypothetical protein
MRRANLTLALAMGTVALCGCGIQEHNVPAKPDPYVLPPASPDAMAAPSSDAMAPSRPGTGGAGGPTGTGGSGDAGPAMPPADSIDLGGTFVHRDKAIVILHFGHSNMLGHGEEPTSLRPHFFETHPRLWSYRGNGNFLPAREPTASTRSRNTAGPGMGLLRAAAALAPEDYHFISIGLGVGSATTQDWSKGGLYYNDFVARASQLRGRVTFGAAVVMLGITDRHLPQAQQGGFADRMVKIAADLRADLGTPNLPVLHTDYEMESTGSLAADSPVGRFFRPLMLTLPMRIPNLAIVPTDMTGMEDDHHFNLAGQKLWADRAIQILVDKGWAPWSMK